MAKIAIDVVIIPPEEIMDKVIAINQKEAKKGNARGPLARDDFYPHISLAMGTIKRGDLNRVKKILTEILENKRPLKLEFTGIYYATKSDGSKSYAFKVKNNPYLRKIHEEIMDQLLPFFSYDATVKELYHQENEKTEPPGHVNKYRDKSSFKNFDPHLTLRCKEAKFNEFPLNFTASTIAICHVGTETTCRKILFQTTLKAHPPNFSLSNIKW